MSIGIGLVGLGFMGKMHFETYQRTGIARVVALCDSDPKKLEGDWSGIAGNIGARGSKVDLSGIAVTTELEQLLKNPAVTVVDITLPTALHEAAVIAALKAGKDVICEKPMARTSSAARRMLKTAKSMGRRLYIAQCIRFWPTYAKAYELVRSECYGALLSAEFHRECSTPMGSHQNWLQAADQSGACALDLHIHDTDFILHCFGKPQAVTSRGMGFSPGRLDHIVTTYEYPGAPLVLAEGAWEHAADYPFAMYFVINFAKGTLRGDHASLVYYDRAGGKVSIPVESGDGYEAELRHFIDCISRKVDSPVVSSESAMESLRIVEAEMASAFKGRRVRIS
ncbi:MAG: Gfo/Idh/MocA family oxidoreductase [Verrucomicrobiota bacterium]|nr:Gfo/Idh/MocA family oxidoreductase [Verrucomicrobiota bacterium]